MNPNSGSTGQQGLRAAGMWSLAISVPDQLITNDFWRRRQPQAVAEAEQRIWMWKKGETPKESDDPFHIEMLPYLDDPFRGLVQRRMLPPTGSALELEREAAQRALQAAKLKAEDIDLLICTSFLPDQHGIGGAAFLAQELGLKKAAWNLESACSSAMLSFQTAANLVKAGQYDRVLVVCSCTYSRASEETDPVAWGVGDAAVAFVVGEVAEGYGFLGGHSLHSGATCGAIEYKIELDEHLAPVYRMRTNHTISKKLKDTAEPFLKDCVNAALARAGVSLGDLSFAVFNTPLAWYSAFCARALGIPREKTINLYPVYANVGPILWGCNLLHAGHWHLEKGDLVLLYSVGSVSSAAASVIRWGDVALGPLPACQTLEEYQALQVESLHPRAASSV
jgi:3-oxoacyl-[acyl-carrier-protein] synthase-3